MCLTKMGSKLTHILNLLYLSTLDCSGKISKEELTRVLTECGRMQLTLKEAEEFIAMVDNDGDGMLDYEEFVNLFTNKLGL